MPASIEPMLTIVPAPPRATISRHDLAARPGSPEIDGGDALPFGVAQLQEVDDGLDAGVVDEDVDRAKLRGHGLDHCFHLLPSGHVGAYGDRLVS